MAVFRFTLRGDAMFTVINDRNGNRATIQLDELEYWYSQQGYTFIKNDNKRAVFLHITDDDNVTYQYYR